MARNRNWENKEEGLSQYDILMGKKKPVQKKPVKRKELDHSKFYAPYKNYCEMMFAKTNPKLYAYKKQREEDHNRKLAMVHPQRYGYEQERAGLYQTKMQVSESTDACEVEADNIAENIVSMTETDIQQKSNSQSDTLQTKSSGGEVSISPSIETAINNLQGGQSLTESERNYFEPRFDADFSGVRIHNSETANELASAINARAFAKNNDIVFGKDEYNTSTEDGKKLMAHELTHVLQQSNTVSQKIIQKAEGQRETPEELINRVGSWENATEQERLQAIYDINCRFWVGPIDELKLEAIWRSFGRNKILEIGKREKIEGITHKSKSGLQLWIDSVEKGADLDDLDIMDMVKNQFRADVKRVARQYLRKNRELAVAEMQSLNIDVQTGTIQAQTESSLQRLTDIQECISKIAPLRFLQEELKNIHVGYNIVPLGEETTEAPANFDPTSRPDLPLKPKDMNKLNATRQPYDVVSSLYQDLQQGINSVSTNFPAVYALLMHNDLEAFAQTANDGPQKALIRIREVLGKVLEALDETEGKLEPRVMKESDIDDRDLTPLHRQLFNNQVSSAIDFTPKREWHTPLAQRIAQECLADHERGELINSIGIGIATIAIVALTTVATGGSAAGFWIGAGVGAGISSIDAARQIEHYLDIASAADTSVQNDLQIVDQSMVDQARLNAIIASAALLLEIPVGRILGRSISSMRRLFSVRRLNRLARARGVVIDKIPRAAQNADNYLEVLEILGRDINDLTLPSGYRSYVFNGRRIIVREGADNSRMVSLVVDDNGLVQVNHGFYGVREGAESVVGTGTRQLGGEVVDTITNRIPYRELENDYYEVIRRITDDSDVNEISRLTGYTVEKVRIAKNHLMFDEHILIDSSGNIYRGRFDPFEDIAELWSKIINGETLNNHELNYMKRLIHHEYGESQILNESRDMLYRAFINRDLESMLTAFLQNKGIDESIISNILTHSPRPITPYQYAHICAHYSGFPNPF